MDLLHVLSSKTVFLLSFKSAQFFFFACWFFLLLILQIPVIFYCIYSFGHIQKGWSFSWRHLRKAIIFLFSFIYFLDFFPLSSVSLTRPAPSNRTVKFQHSIASTFYGITYFNLQADLLMGTRISNLNSFVDIFKFLRTHFEFFPLILQMHFCRYNFFNWSMHGIACTL